MYVQPYFPQSTPIMQRTNQEDKPAKQQPYIPSPLDYQILQYVRAYHFLTVWQLVKLHYSDGSLTRARVLLLRLHETGYLDRRALPHVGLGQTTYIFELATKRINYLTDQGFSAFSRHPPNQPHHFKYPPPLHIINL